MSEIPGHPYLIVENGRKVGQAIDGTLIGNGSTSYDSNTLVATKLPLVEWVSKTVFWSVTIHKSRSTTITIINNSNTEIRIGKKLVHNIIKVLRPNESTTLTVEHRVPICFSFRLDPNVRGDLILKIDNMVLRYDLARIVKMHIKYEPKPTEPTKPPTELKVDVDILQLEGRLSYPNPFLNYSFRITNNSDYEISVEPYMILDGVKYWAVPPNKMPITISPHESQTISGQARVTWGSHKIRFGAEVYVPALNKKIVVKTDEKTFSVTSSQPLITTPNPRIVDAYMEYDGNKLQAGNTVEIREGTVMKAVVTVKNEGSDGNVFIWIYDYNTAEIVKSKEIYMKAGEQKTCELAFVPELGEHRYSIMVGHELGTYTDSAGG